MRASGSTAILIEPGLIRTSFGEVAASSAGKGSQPDDPYAAFMAAVARATRESYQRGPLARLGGGPEAVARTVERALISQRPKARYTVTSSVRLLIAARRLLPDRLWDGFLRTQFPHPC